MVHFVIKISKLHFLVQHTEDLYHSYCMKATSEPLQARILYFMHQLHLCLTSNYTKASSQLLSCGLSVSHFNAFCFSARNGVMSVQKSCAHCTNMYT